MNLFEYIFKKNFHFYNQSENDTRKRFLSTFIGKELQPIQSLYTHRYVHEKISLPLKN